ncbi:hypothetical protein [Roseovarius aestuarii]|uniref:Uncharacterized protein n=1 Tax=Roseovarius aestuarii TaxID=475083 RepID=A0A1X7BSJ8_9RHOB|nr:hypothetical protein [Roseovarius aestuarii]SMC12588.1 hypothetical protein ROA7745_02416 [Roseovarius aestuarii]
MDDDILMAIHASAPRRVFGVSVLGLLGTMLIFVALSQPPSNPAWAIFLLGFGAGAVWMAYRMWEVTRHRLELTETELRSSDGTVIAQTGDIRSMDRGMFAFKPSNGFMLRLKTKAPRRWRPGLWWSLGDRIGVGGVTSAPQTKAMAEMISAMIASRPH